MGSPIDPLNGALHFTDYVNAMIYVYAAIFLFGGLGLWWLYLRVWKRR